MKRRLKWALVLSVVFHAALLGVWRRTPEKFVQPNPSPAPVEFELVEAPEPEPVPVPERRVVHRPSPRPKLMVEAPAVAQAPANPSPTPDFPRTAVLLPRDSQTPPPPPLGQTIHNLPSELPDPAAVRAYEAETMNRRVDGWAKKTLARHRVESGVVSYYFHDLRHRFEDVTKEPPPFIEPFGLESLPSHGQQAINAWSAAAKRYGATGSAYEQPAGYRRDWEVPTSVQETAAKGGKQAKEFEQKVQAGARLREFADGRMGEELFAVVELRQGSNGALADLSLIQPSSSGRFDTWVMAQAPKALDGLVHPPDAGVGIHADGMRSVWAFKGRVTYKRNLKETELLEDGWYLALMAVPGMLTGNFDEVSGKVEYVDLRHPRYECRVNLLEVY